MALHLGNYLIFGELFNTSHYGTHGFLALRGEIPGEETLIRLELTGHCARDLRGKHFRFFPAEDDPEQHVFTPEVFPDLQMQQAGVTGLMTSQGWVRALPCPAVEFYTRCKLGEPPPTRWVRHLYLEWYSQNGRILIELAGARVEACTREPGDEDDEGEWEEIPNLALPPSFDPDAHAGPEISIIEREGESFHEETFRPNADDPDPETEPLEWALQRRLDAEADAVDRALRGEDEESQYPEMEAMDRCLEHGELQCLASFLGSPAWPAPEGLDDAKAEEALKSLLARLAIFGVAYDLCEHYTPREAYTLLAHTILHKPLAYRELSGTGWVQHFSTSDYCRECYPDNDPEDLDPDKR